MAQRHRKSVKGYVEDALKFIIDKSIIQLIFYVRRRTLGRGLYEILYERAMSTSAAYIEANSKEALFFENKTQLWDFVFKKIKYEGLFAEFGVYKGQSINHFAKNLQNKNIKIYGFDSFEGLKEDWLGTPWEAGTFNVGGQLPDVLPNVVLTKGWFDQTLPPFLDEHRGTFSFVHLDADTFQSTELVLNLIANRIGKDTVIIFDEYLGYQNWQNGEYLAWQNFVSAHNVKYKYLGFSNLQAAVQIL